MGNKLNNYGKNRNNKEYVQKEGYNLAKNHGVKSKSPLIVSGPAYNRHRKQAKLILIPGGKARFIDIDVDVYIHLIDSIYKEKHEDVKAHYGCVENQPPSNFMDIDLCGSFKGTKNVIMECAKNQLKKYNTNILQKAFLFTVCERCHYGEEGRKGTYKYLKELLNLFGCNLEGVNEAKNTFLTKTGAKKRNKPYPPKCGPGCIMNDRRTYYTYKHKPMIKNWGRVIALNIHSYCDKDENGNKSAPMIECAIIWK